MNFRYIFLVILFFYFNDSNAQFSLKVTVKDSATSEILIGATIVEDGTTNAAATDINGNAFLTLNKSGDLKFNVSLLGYENKNVIITIPQKEKFFEILLVANSQELEEVTISSDRTNSRIEDIPTRIEVIGRDDLLEENGIKPGNILSILGDIAGIQIQQTSASSGNTFARIQGLNGRYTQLLKDGMPMFGGLSGNFGIMQIPPLDLKQIEIIKGSASTLYGGDAIGGIINIVSKEPSFDRELSFTLNQTSIGETDANGYYAKRNDKVGFSIFAGHILQTAYDVDNDGLSETPSLNNTVIHPRLEFYFGKKSALTLNYTGTFEDRHGGNMLYIADNTLGNLYHVNSFMKRHNADLKWKYDISGNKNVMVKMSGSFLKQDLATKRYFFKAQQKIFYSEVSYVTKTENMDWVTGINFNGDNFENNSLNLPGIENYNFTTLGFFAQNTWRPVKKLTIESGLRGDLQSEYKFFPLGRISLMYKFDEKFSMRLNGGMGYKIPTVISYVDQETDLDKVKNVMGLKPELSNGMNADLNYAHEIFKEMFITINQSFFITSLSRPVYDSLTPDQLNIVLKNGSDPLLTKGTQTYVRLSHHEKEFYLSYVYTDVKKKYDNTFPRLAVTPMHNLSGTFYFPFHQWRFGIESSFIAGQLDQNYNPVKNYTLAAAMIQYRFSKVILVLNCENLFDFRQNKYEKIYDGSIDNPDYHKLWAPIEGRVINISMMLNL
jgi:outer membrane receptor for ferrienterochelin and colicins